MVTENKIIRTKIGRLIKEIIKDCDGVKAEKMKEAFLVGDKNLRFRTRLEVLREYDKCRDGELKPYYLWISELFKEKEVVKILYEKKDGFIFVNKKDPAYEVVTMEETPKIEIDTRPVGINVPPSFSNYWNEYKHKMEEEKSRWIQNMTAIYPTLSEIYDD